MKSERIRYSEFEIVTISADCADEVPAANSNEYYRVELPFNPYNTLEMRNKGYAFVDRSIGVEISLKRSKVEYQKLIRFEIRKADDTDMLSDKLR